MLARLLALSALLLVAAPVAAGDEGIDLGAAHQIRITGRVVDAATNQPVYGAQVSVEGPYLSRRADSGPDGQFVLATGAEEGLGTLSIAVNHSEFQQKYVEAVFRDALRHDVEVTVSPGRVHVKAKRLDGDVVCGGRVEVETRAGGAAPITAICEQGLTGVEIEVRRTRVAVLAAGPFTLRIRNGRLEVRDSKNDAIELRLHAAMQPR
jgi:hypothetical protein